ncbi:MAG: M28 family peptidase [Betaproteobacteria bacterium]|nr:MAG: M28 family peptidase [Betaproteobacteria bacterium]
MPGHSHEGALNFTPAETELAARLRAHVEALAAGERNVDLERPARYIEQQFGGSRSQQFQSGGRWVRNIEAGAGPIVVGAHYDTVPGSPGADDNASGVAVLLELARMGLPARFVAFANEEMPYFQSGEMGSHAWAARAHRAGDKISAMLSLEMLGYYRNVPRSQGYPPPLGWFYPDRANFIAFVGDLDARRLVRHAVGFFRKYAKFPAEGVAAPAGIPGVTWSDHWSFRSHGYPAIMVTDTAFYRYPHYHLPSDTPEKLDYMRMARVTLGLAAVIKELANENR